MLTMSHSCPFKNLCMQERDPTIGLCSTSWHITPYHNAAADQPLFSLLILPCWLNLILPCAFFFGHAILSQSLHRKIKILVIKFATWDEFPFCVGTFPCSPLDLFLFCLASGSLEVCKPFTVSLSVLKTAHLMSMATVSAGLKCCCS